VGRSSTGPVKCGLHVGAFQILGGRPEKRHPLAPRLAPARKRERPRRASDLVVRGGVEPPTFRFSEGFYLGGSEQYFRSYQAVDLRKWPIRLMKPY
jgi:hypothetical protein